MLKNIAFVFVFLLIAGNVAYGLELGPVWIVGNSTGKCATGKVTANALELAANMTLQGYKVIPADLIAPRHVGTFVKINMPIDGTFWAFSMSKETCETSLKFWKEIDTAMKEKVFKGQPKDASDYMKRFGEDSRKPASSSWW